MKFVSHSLGKIFTNIRNTEKNILLKVVHFFLNLFLKFGRKWVWIRDTYLLVLIESNYKWNSIVAWFNLGIHDMFWEKEILVIVMYITFLFFIWVHMRIILAVKVLKSTNIISGDLRCGLHSPLWCISHTFVMLYFYERKDNLLAGLIQYVNFAI